MPPAAAALASAPMFAKIVGPAWATLDPPVRDLHAVTGERTFAGRVDVSRGASAAARLACTLFGLPPDGRDQPLTIVMRPEDDGEHWERRFATGMFRSVQTAGGPLRVRERVGPVTTEQTVVAEGGGLVLTVARGWFLGLPLPRAFLPGGGAREWGEDGRYRFAVALTLPLGGAPLVRYEGWLAPA